MARALGMFDLCQYELEKGEVLLFPGAENTTGIDLLAAVARAVQPGAALWQTQSSGYGLRHFDDRRFDVGLRAGFWVFEKSQGVAFISEPHGGG